MAADDRFVPFEDRRYILQERDGEFVERTRSPQFETLRLCFDFTKDRTKAKRFTFNDLYSPLATTSVGIEFARGFSGRLVRVR